MTTDTLPQPSANRQIARAAAVVMAAFIVSNLAGLVRDILVAHAFGTSAEMDSFNAANRVVELLYNLAAGGALASAFVPTFTGFITRQQVRSAWRLASAVINLVLLAIAALSLLAGIFAPQVVRYGLFLLAPGSSPGQLELTAALLRIMLPSIAIFAVSGLMMGVLNAHQVFLIPALAPAMYSLGIIAGAVLLAPHWGIRGLAWGVVLGAALHLLVQLPALYRLRGTYSFTLGKGLAEVGEVFRLMLPRLFGVAVVQVNFLVNTIIALSLPAGSATSITLAFRLMLMPQMAVAQSVAIAALPTFSAQAALGKLEEMRASMRAVLRGVLLLAIPATVGLILLRTPLVALLYQRGEFTAASTQLVAWALLWYAVGLVSHSLVEILARAFYALHDTKTPVLVTSIAMLLNIAFSLLFTRLFAAVGWLPHGGLALANTLATTLEMTTLLVLLRRRLDGLEGNAILAGVSKSVIASIAMGAAVWLWSTANFAQSPAIQVLGGVTVGGLLYAAMLWLLRVEELYRLWSALHRRIFPKSKGN